MRAGERARAQMRVRPPRGLAGTWRWPWTQARTGRCSSPSMAGSPFSRAFPQALVSMLGKTIPLFFPAYSQKPTCFSYMDLSSVISWIPARICSRLKVTSVIYR
ncbi:hypothetical protein JB92DRAFT_2040067 [Gautieria morchelliformis]|nr:hypothetical protein JB92DRAFT_2040067 [Gautieria morchelliformis]